MAIFVSSTNIITEDDIAMAFKHFNGNDKKNKMTEANLKTWSKSVSIRYSKEELIRALNQIKKDEFSSLSFEEFRDEIRRAIDGEV